MTDPDGVRSERVLAEALRVMAGDDHRSGAPSPQESPSPRTPLTRTQVLLLAVLVGLIIGIISGLLAG